MKYDAMLLVRSDLVRRIDSLAEQRGHLTLARICEEIDEIRHIARAHGMDPLEQLASMLESALAMHGLGPVVLSYLDMMRDAAGCEVVGRDVSTAYLAAMSLRLGA